MCLVAISLLVSYFHELSLAMNNEMMSKVTRGQGEGEMQKKNWV